MANNDASAVLERLLDDEYIHEQLAAAGAGLRDAYRRARRLPPRKAVQDKTVYDRVRQAAGGLKEEKDVKKKRKNNKKKTKYK